jgi:hypothetical protein
MNDEARDADFLESSFGFLVRLSKGDGALESDTQLVVLDDVECRCCDRGARVARHGTRGDLRDESGAFHRACVDVRDTRERIHPRATRHLVVEEERTDDRRAHRGTIPSRTNTGPTKAKRDLRARSKRPVTDAPGQSQKPSE